MPDAGATDGSEEDGGPLPGSSIDAGEANDGPCRDQDGDGFFDCVDPNFPERPQTVDCDDERWFVQPGGYEFPANGIDDNCDGLVDAEEWSGCECPDAGDSSAAGLLAAVDLCDDTVTQVSKPFGNAEQFGAFTSFYGIGPQDGACLTTMSSGHSYAEGGTSLTYASGFEDPDPAAPSAGATVNDLAQLKVALHPPPNARGVEFRFMFMSVEWPEFLCSQYNDTFYALAETSALNDGAPTNVSFDPQGRPITVNVGFFESPRLWTTPLGDAPYGEIAEGAMCTAFPIQNCNLPGYCFEAEQDLAYHGSGSGWLTTRFPISNVDEEIWLTFSIHDEGDGILDSLVILDRLRWTPYQPDTQTVKE